MAFAGVSRRGNERHGAPERNSLAHHARQVVDDHACLHVRKSGAAAALERAREVARTRTARQHRDREGSGHAAQDIGRGTINDAGVPDSASCALAAMDRRQGRRSRAAQGRARDAASGSSGLAPFRRDIKTIDAGAGVSRSEIDPPVGSMTVSGNPPLFALMFKNIESGLDQDKNTPENNELHGQPTLLAVPKRASENGETDEVRPQRTFAKDRREEAGVKIVAIVAHHRRSLATAPAPFVAFGLQEQGRSQRKAE